MSSNHRSSRRKDLNRHENKRQSAYLLSSPKCQDDYKGSSLSASNETDLEALDKEEPILPGKILSIPKRKISINTSDHVLPTSVVRESFHRRAGIREVVDASGAYKLRTVEIKQKHNESVGFYIRQGDGWRRSDGIFVSRVNLGSVVDINDLLHIGDEIVKVNGVDISGYPMNDVVSLIKKKRNTLRLTVKLPVSQATFQKGETKKLPLQEEESSHETVAAMDLFSEIAIRLESTPDLKRPQEPQDLSETGSESGRDDMVSTPEQVITKRDASLLENLTSTAQDYTNASTGESLNSSLLPTHKDTQTLEKQSSSPPHLHKEIKAILLQSPPIHEDTSYTSDNHSSRSSSPPPSPPNSPVPDLQGSPSSLHRLSESSFHCELSDSLKDLLSPLEKFPPNEEEYCRNSHSMQMVSASLNSFQSGFSSSPTLDLRKVSTSLPPSHLPTPPSLLPPTPPASLPSSHPPTPPTSPPPSPDSSPPPLPKSPPPLLAYEPLTPNTSDHLELPAPTTESCLPSKSVNEDLICYSN